MSSNGYAQVKVRAMPKMCERGNAQNLSSSKGNSQNVKGYAQFKVRAMPKSVRGQCPKNGKFQLFEFFQKFMSLDTLEHQLKLISQFLWDF